MLDALGTLFPAGSTWTHPGRRLLRLGDRSRTGLDAKAMLPRAVQRPGRLRARAPRSTPTAADADHLRLSYCYPEPARIREGVRRLAGVIDEEMDLRATFGPATGPRARPGRPRPSLPSGFPSPDLA